MRAVKYLSLTSIMKWRDDREYFYLQYLAEDRPPREPQTQPMSIGSAFDAYVKSYIHSHIDELKGDSDFKLGVLFESQGEEHNRPWARVEGLKVFDAYRRSGALADLMLQLACCEETPMFEFMVHGTLEKHGISGDVGGVTLLGKPDAYFTTLDGARVILDWKVNGYCAKRVTSPKPGYLKIRDGSEQGSRNNNAMHRECIPMLLKGILINGATKMEHVYADWALQLCVYAWLCGEGVGADFVVYIDQICGPADKIRVAQHRCCIGQGYQERLFEEIEEIWEIVQSDHVFREMSKERSMERCKILDAKAAGLRIETTSMDSSLEWNNK